MHDDVDFDGSFHFGRGGELLSGPFREGDIRFVGQLKMIMAAMSGCSIGRLRRMIKACLLVALD